VARAGVDPFGRALADWSRGGSRSELLERDDGFLQEGAGPLVYLAGVRHWPAAERRALRYVRGPVLDVGCGAGRVALELQRRGIEVVGLDASPEAADAATRRGVGEVWTARLEAVGERLGDFDTLVLFGNNFGIFGTPPRARRALAWLARRTSASARILCESTSPHFSGAPGLTRPYVARNVADGRAPGQLRVRYHYDGLVGDWFDWIYLTTREMRELVAGTGWQVARFVRSAVSDPYVAVLIRVPTGDEPSRSRHGAERLA
jgi:SAM-dependent methyltransferase